MPVVFWLLGVVGIAQYMLDHFSAELVNLFAHCLRLLFQFTVSLALLCLFLLQMGNLVVQCDFLASEGVDLFLQIHNLHI